MKNLQCVASGVVAFVCPNTSGYKYKSDLLVTQLGIQGNCGSSVMGYNEVDGGEGSWTAGYALSNDHFCSRDFTVGS